MMLISKMLQITRDAKMSFSDKVSWVGGMLGLFTGFSVISGIEVLYWLWFKVVFHKHDAEVTPSRNDMNKKIDELENKNESQIKELKVKSVLVNIFNYIKRNFYFSQNELEELKINLKSSHGSDPKAGLFFDAIFNDAEAENSKPA